MIKNSLLPGLLLAMGLAAFQLPACAQERDASASCGQTQGVPCADASAASAGNGTRPLSAARSDGMKKRQLTALIRMNEANLFREEGMPTTAARPAGAKKF